MFNKKKSTREMVKGKEVSEDLDMSINNTHVQEEKAKKKKPCKEKGMMKDYSFFRSKLFWGCASTASAILLAFAGVPAVISQAGQTVDVVVFKENATIGAQITSNMVDYEQMSAYNLPIGAKFNVDDVTGKYVTAQAISGDIVTDSRLSDTYPGDSPELVSLPVGKLAVSFTLADLAESVSSKLRAGDIIQIFAVLDSSNQAGDLMAQMPPELQCVKILAVTSSEGADVDENGNAVNEPAQISTVTVEVTKQQAAVLVGLEHMATLHAALVVRGDSERAEQALAQQEALLSANESEEQPIAEIPLETGNTEEGEA